MKLNVSKFIVPIRIELLFITSSNFSKFDIKYTRLLLQETGL